jgi:predicted ABC-type ATPase
LAQDGVASFLGLVTDQKMSFGYETVFSYWKEMPDGTVESKISNLQKDGYYVVLLFVGLVSAQLSIARVDTRKRQGGHAVDVSKLISRFPRTQKAVGHAATVADMTIMFDNSATAEMTCSPLAVPI